MNKIQVRMEENEDGKFVFDIKDFIDCMNEESKKMMCDYFTFTHIADSLERQLKRQTDLDSWDASGWRDCSKLREFIIRVQGVEPEFKKDLESRIRALEHDVAHYKKYYDWYFKLNHHGFE